MIRVLIPYHLRVLAKVDGELQFEISQPATIGVLLDAIEARYPALQGAIREHQTKARRPLVRYFVCEQDWSLEPAGKALPEAVLSGREPFWIVGAIAGG
jgi:hypothetical protein